MIVLIVQHIKRALASKIGLNKTFTTPVYYTVFNDTILTPLVSRIYTPTYKYKQNASNTSVNIIVQRLKLN